MRQSSLQHAGGRRGVNHRQRQRLRFGLFLLAVPAWFVAVWALVAPRSFFNDFPGLGFTWVGELPRYSEHLVRDVGALNLALAVLLTWAALGLERATVRAALVAWLVFSIPHFIFHALHLERYESDDARSLMISLGLGLVLPLLLIPANERLERRSVRMF